MIRKQYERFSYTQNFNANEFVVVAYCNCCNGEFLFATIKHNTDNEKEARWFPISEFFQFDLIKFCPLCGARNTKPAPVAHKDA